MFVSPPNRYQPGDRSVVQTLRLSGDETIGDFGQLRGICGATWRIETLGDFRRTVLDDHGETSVGLDESELLEKVMERERSSLMSFQF